MNKYKNADGTYDGASLLHDLTGIPKDELMWTFERMKALLRMGVSKDETRKIIDEERQDKPWLNT